MMMKRRQRGPCPRGCDGFTDEQLRACVLDGGTRFVAPGQVWCSDERKAVKGDDVVRALPALGDAVEQLDLSGCKRLTDPSIIALANACKSLVTLKLQYASSRADARARARARDARVAARAAPYSRRTRSALTRARAAPLPSRPMRLTLARASPDPSRFRSRQALPTADGPEHHRDRGQLQGPKGAQRRVRVAAAPTPLPAFRISRARPTSLSSGTANS